MTEDDAGETTLDDDEVECPACLGTGHARGDALVRANGCHYCLGKGQVSTSAAVAFLEANPSRWPPPVGG